MYSSSSTRTGVPRLRSIEKTESDVGRKKYNDKHPDNPLPNIISHVSCHTFCTNMTLSGMDLKVLQYIMGHSEIEVTMNVYTHMNYERASAQMFELVDGEPFGKDERRVISRWA